MSDLSKVRLLLSYDGTEFSGWQRQGESRKPTVQGTLEQLLSQLFDEPVKVIGASRTDAGVHALGQVAHFLAPKALSGFNVQHSLNRMANSALVVRGSWEAPPKFHAIASSTGKIYRFLIHNHHLKSPMRRNRTAWIREKLDLEFLNKGSEFLIGEHDFKSFQTSGSDATTTVRQIHKAHWREVGPHLVEFSIAGNGFLRQMIRNIVGTLIDLHNDREAPEMMKKIIEAKDRRQALGTAEPEGLYLVRVLYPRDLDIGCRKL
jgi:tRNA pseudouridine38-40 synthase